MSSLKKAMFSLFLGYVNSKQTLFKSYLINCPLFHFTMQTLFQSYVKAIYFLWFFYKVDYEVYNLFPKAK